LEDLETPMITTNATLKRQSNRIIRENERGRREGYHQEELLGSIRGGEMNRRSEETTHLIRDRKARREIPMKESFHAKETREITMVVGGLGGGRERGGWEEGEPFYTWVSNYCLAEIVSC
jgi:hypothetical protein